MSEEKKAYEADTGEYEIELGEQENEVEVEVPESAASVETPVQEDTSSDHEEYNNSVQKRIDKLTKKMREAERREQAALEYAQNVQSEVHQLKGRVKTLDEGYLNQYGERLSTQQQSAEADLRKAVELGDSDAVVAAQKKLTELAIAGDRYRGAMSQRQAQMQQEQAYAQQVPQQQAAPQQPKRPDPKAEDWAENNTWFGQDEAMTFAAFGIHKKLVEREGFDPQSDDYYNELDNRIRVAFPHRFNDGTSRRTAQTVAGVSRSSNSGRSSKVRLSRSQVAIAKKLGVPLEEYAKYVKKEA